MASVDFPELNGTRAQAIRLTIPYNGIWTADVALDQDVSSGATGAVTLAFAGITAKATVFASGEFIGTGTFRILGGAGGWQNNVDAKFYQNNVGGLKLSDVLADTARAVGESVNIASNVSIGTAFARTAGRAVRALNSLAPTWWMGLDGVTQIGTRAAPSITSNFEVIPLGTSLSLGRVIIATDTPEDWIPGSFFESLTLPRRQISYVIHYLDADKLRTEVWTM